LCADSTLLFSTHLPVALRAHQISDRLPGLPFIERRIRHTFRSSSAIRTSQSRHSKRAAHPTLRSYYGPSLGWVRLGEKGDDDLLIVCFKLADHEPHPGHPSLESWARAPHISATDCTTTYLVATMFRQSGRPLGWRENRGARLSGRAHNVWRGECRRSRAVN
jgi:hypothetical protein